MSVALYTQYFPRVLWTKSQAFYSGGIRTHDPCNSRAVSVIFFTGLGESTEYTVLHTSVYMVKTKKNKKIIFFIPMQI